MERDYQTKQIMLVKRPLLVGEDVILIGFKEEEWVKKLLISSVYKEKTKEMVKFLV